MDPCTAKKPHLPLCRNIIGLVRDKWSLKLLHLLSANPLRFSELRRQAEPISQKMLSQSLRELERYGLIERMVAGTVPPQVSYGPTALGVSFLDMVSGICRWTIGNVDDLENAMLAFDARNSEVASEVHSGLILRPATTLA
jgi:DNA-binding HxlR family transcriptional regulator